MIHKFLSTINGVLSANKLQIFIYHQVLDVFDPIRSNEPTEQEFEWQMLLVSKYFTPLRLTDAVNKLNNKCLPKNAICITFDDGYLNNLKNAQPILKKYNIPATVYVATEFSGTKNMWNDRVIHLFSQRESIDVKLSEDGDAVKLIDLETRKESAYRLLAKLKYLEPQVRSEKVDELYRLNPNIAEQENLMMTPKQINIMSSQGIDIGAHTHTHPILKVLNKAQQHSEILKSRQLLEEWTGKTIEHFAYPNGIWQKDLDEQTVDIVKNLNFKSAVITNWGTATDRTSNYLLPRFTPWDRSRVKFHARIVVDNIKSMWSS